MGVCEYIYTHRERENIEAKYTKEIMMERLMYLIRVIKEVPSEKTC